ncbi:MAG TPA: hypothetical protein VM683_14270 [Anaeromyxobacteraceae bacterium]|nr:hypothetical protein [Anaeromyxobacteraceae bacterium]
MKIVVIGASGTIGKAVADALAPRHEIVRAGSEGSSQGETLDARKFA